jgi:hypothetical protein
MGEQGFVPPPPKIKDKRSEPKMTARLSALVKWVPELHEAGLKACHYAKEFNLWRICPLGCQEKLAYECPQLDDPSREPTGGKIISLIL